MDIVVIEAKAHGESGHVEVTVQAVETDGAGNTTRGPIKTYGISADVLLSGYNGSVDMFLRDVKIKHQNFHMLHKDLISSLHAAKGTTL